MFFEVFFGVLLALIVFKYRKTVFELAMVVLAMFFLAACFFYFFGQSETGTPSVADITIPMDAATAKAQTRHECLERWIKDSTVICEAP